MPPNTIEEIKKELADQRALIERTYVSVEKTRKYFLWTLIITVALFVLPLVALAFVIPFFLNSYTSALQGLGI